MPRYLITTKQMKNANGVRIEPGMSVEVVTQLMTNPVLTNGGQLVVDAFMRIYGIDIRRAGILNMTYLTVERIKLFNHYDKSTRIKRRIIARIRPLIIADR